MSLKLPARKAFALAACCATAILAGCAEKAPPPAPAPPPVAEAPPPVALSPRLIEQASAYRAYVDRAAQISPAFTDGASVAQGLKTGESYEPGQFLRGAIAYGAVVALQEPAFRAGVKTYTADADQRRTIAYEIMKDPAYALGIGGAQTAAALVAQALGDDGRKLLESGKAVKQAAYDVQHQAWSKAEVAARDSRLAMAKQLSATPISGAPDISAKLQLAVVGTEPLTVASSNAGPPFSPLVVRAVAVAALAALGYADDASLANVMPLVAEPTSAQCLNMSKLNLYQCLAVAKPHYEDVFCLGQHVLMDTGACLMKGVGLPDPIERYVPHVDATPVSTKATSKKSKRRR